MTPQAIQLALFVLEEAIKHAPEMAAEIQKLFTKAEPTAADWDELRARVLSKSYFDHVPASQLAQRPD